MNLDNKKLLEYSNEHVFYELDMLLRARDLCRAERLDQFQINSAIEIFVIHLRCLITFLYPKNNQKGDVLAKHFFSDPGEWLTQRPPLPPTLKDARDRANKELAHLTEGRKSPGDPSKPWDAEKLTQDIMPILKTFCALADKNKLAERVVNLVNNS